MLDEPRRREALGRSAIVHLAAHAIADPVRPLESYLVLGDAGAEFGRLEHDDLGGHGADAEGSAMQEADEKEDSDAVGG